MLVLVERVIDVGCWGTMRLPATLRLVLPRWSESLGSNKFLGRNHAGLSSVRSLMVNAAGAERLDRPFRPPETRCSALGPPPPTPTPTPGSSLFQLTQSLPARTSLLAPTAAKREIRREKFGRTRPSPRQPHKQLQPDPEPNFARKETTGSHARSPCLYLPCLPV
ncbi:hypothetical protein B0T26DRAFT_208784 [Lasiosphaeria miniovina]|uniref:Uncharacterized protein n=1 Tax=Lasiosphaeria miniovina TaxID=1954250 RepID=A0AA40E262_9PEZI|nr:uncharacterized protein B0T26DRAFT_208784 [Lasiosphaeria miniovina]KAK0722227.1 hypothetical protein B0T26DRAFT_208784 [Lasiosphaeria miniovina]